MRHSRAILFLSLLMGLALSCSHPSAVEIQKTAPTPALIGKWFDQAWEKSHGKSSAESRCKASFQRGVVQVVEAIHSDQPLKIKADGFHPFIEETVSRPVVHTESDGRTSMTMVDEKVFRDPKPAETEPRTGLPYEFTGVCDPGSEEAWRENGFERALDWFASKGIYAVNSTKRKRP